MSQSRGVTSASQIQTAILPLRDQRVILDADLARLYGVSTKRLNEQVKRNLDRFPSDFVFQLTPSEKAEVVANCDHLARLKFSPQRPYAFTEHGAIMAANVLNSSQAVQASVMVVRAPLSGCVSSRRRTGNWPRNSTNWRPGWLTMTSGSPRFSTPSANSSRATVKPAVNSRLATTLRRRGRPGAVALRDDNDAGRRCPSRNELPKTVGL